MYVLDANVVIPACTVERGFRRFGRQRLVAPPFMWSEAVSSIHHAVWRGEFPALDGRNAVRRLVGAPVRAMDPPALHETAWDIADELGLAKTYDAEYLALARLLGCVVVTNDERLHRGAERMGLTVLVEEL